MKPTLDDVEAEIATSNIPKVNPYIARSAASH